MRSLVRTISAIALAALITLVPVAAASAAKKQKPAAWAKKHHLKGSWRAKDVDKDGVKNLAEFKLGTNPRKADSDRDGLKDGDEVKSGNNPLKADTDGDKVKDGAEHAGVVTKFDGETITIRQFKGGTLVATLSADAECVAAGDDADATADDSVADDEDFEGDGAVEVTEDDDWSDEDDFSVRAASFEDPEEEEVDLGDDEYEDDYADDASYDGCSTEDIEKGTVLKSAEIERSGGTTFVVALEFA
jgi:hypothetical protein